MVQECSHDRTYFGLEYLQQDLCNIMEKLVPTCRVENQYLHPGPKHVEFGDSVGEPGPWTSLNTDAHLRSCFFGRSESIAIEEGKMIWENSDTPILSIGIRSVRVSVLCR